MKHHKRNFIQLFYTIQYKFHKTLASFYQLKLMLPFLMSKFHQTKFQKDNKYLSFSFGNQTSGFILDSLPGLMNDFKYTEFKNSFLNCLNLFEKCKKYPIILTIFSLWHVALILLLISLQ